jgi:hypothetical protein
MTDFIKDFIKEFWWSIICTFTMLLAVVFCANAVWQAYWWGFSSFLQPYFWQNFIGETFTVYTAVYFSLLLVIATLSKKRN